MPASVFDLVPAAQRDIAQAALTSAFGAAPITGLQLVTGGASGALTYRADIAGRAYLLRLETRRSPLRNPHQYTCMRIAAEAGVAPPLHYVDDTAGVAIMEFLPQHSLSE